MNHLFKEIESHALSDMEIICVLDGFEPRLAQIVIDTINEIRDEGVFSLMFGVVCDEAYRRTNWN